MYVRVGHDRHKLVRGDGRDYHDGRVKGGYLF